ncbi:MAG: CPBP family glutamic-type intramembrane protease [Candidatus Saccharimonadales bacterium]
MKQTVFRIISLVLLVLAGFLLLVPHIWIGWLCWGLGLALTPLGGRLFWRHLVLIFIPIAILGLIPINTDLSFEHITIMGSALTIAVIGPYLISRFIYKENIIKYPLTNGRWQWWHYGYIALTALLAYLILPVWLLHTGDYLNWSVPTGLGGLTTLFLGTNGLGIWDELFFVLTCLTLLRLYMPFIWANLIQATLWTAFLFDLGFQAWMPLLIFPFALLQGIVYKRTHSLLYLLAIHLTLDLVLYLALINAHNPQLLNIFIAH